MTMFSTDSVKANYEDSKNKLYLSITNEEIKITIQYQRGIVKDDTTLILCKGTIGKPTCDSPVNIPLLDKESREYISNKDATIADNEITKQSFVLKTKNIQGFPSVNSNTTESYTLFLQAKFCEVREIDLEGYPTGECNIANESAKMELVSFTIANLLDDAFEKGNQIEDEDMRNLMNKISDIVDDYVLPIIWSLLGLLLIIKGTMLGVQIVKSADEPQVRQEKIHSMKWLVIGVAIAASASAVVKVLLNFFERAFE